MSTQKQPSAEKSGAWRGRKKEAPASLGRRLIDAPFVSALPDLSDRELIGNAIGFGCAVFCTCDRRSQAGAPSSHAHPNINSDRMVGACKAMGRFMVLSKFAARVPPTDSSVFIAGHKAKRAIHLARVYGERKRNFTR